MHAAVLVNPHAGAVRRNPRLIDRLRATLGAHGELRVTQDAGALTQVAEELAARGCKHIGVVGGDGSASNTLTAIARAYSNAPLPSVALLRGGTMNTVAKSLGVPFRSPVRLLSRALRAWDAPDVARFRTRPCLTVGDRLGFLFGTGVWYGFLDAYYRAGDGRPTPTTAAQVLIRGALSALVSGPTIARMLHESVLEVRSDLGLWAPRPYVTVAAATVSEAGLGFRAFPRAYETNERFPLLALSGPPADIAWELPGVHRGHGFSPRLAQEGLVSWTELRASDGPLDYVIDGDLFQADGPLAVRLGPSFSFLTTSAHLTS